MPVERFVPEDEKLANCYEQGLAHGLPPGSNPAAVRLRLAKHQIGEPPLHDRLKDVGFIMAERAVELSEGRDGIPGCNSEIGIIRDHQALWGIEDPMELRNALIELITREQAA